MVFFKKIQVTELNGKYGGPHKGLIATEPIKKNETIWCCNCSEKDGTFTRDQLLEIIHKYPKLNYFIRSFSYMIDDDLYAMPMTYLEEKNNDECAFLNHSCDPNCGFGDDAFADNIIACRDILPGEELTCHYGALETETSLIYGLECKCNSPSCCGMLTFDFYRNQEFVDKYYNYMTPYLKQKVLDMRERWYSSNCYVKRFPSQYIGFNEFNSDEWQKGLCSIGEIKCGELVASFNGDEEIMEGKHYIRNSDNPNCQLIGREVYANNDIPPNTELSLYYHGILL